MNDLQALLYLAIYFISLILCYKFLFSKRRSGFMQFVKYVMVPLTMLGGWIIYFIGYHYGNIEKSSIHNIIAHSLQAIFSTGRLFILGNDLIEIPVQIKETTAFLLWFSFIGASAVFISMSILIHLFGKRIITRLKIWTNFSKENYIFFGVNEASISLAKDLLGTNSSRLVVFIKKIDKDEDSKLYHQVEETGALVLNRESIVESLQLEREEGIFHVHKEYSEPKNLKKLKLIKKVLKNNSHFFFLSNKEEWNMSMAHSIINEINPSSIKDSITFHILTKGSEMEDLFYECLSSKSNNIHFRLLNQADIAARQLVKNYNPIDWLDKDTSKAIATSDFNVLIIGFDQTGNAVLRKLLEYGQFVGSIFKTIIIDSSLQTKKGRFENRYPGVISNYSINFIETCVGTTEYFDIIDKYKNELDLIVITLGNDELNIQTAFDIQQIVIRNSLKKIKIIAQIKNNYSYKEITNASQFVINTFGRIEDIFTEDIVVRGKLEAMAKRIHEYYNTKKHESKHKAWDELTKIEQASNISAAEHIYIKLTLAGLKVEEIKKFNDNKEYLLNLGKEKIDNLAKGEHLHWNAVLFTNAWQKWELKDVPLKSSAHKDNLRKLHACLVNWEELKEVGDRFGENYFQYDYETISDIFKLIKEEIYSHSNH